MRWLYPFLMRLLLPVALVALAWRAIRDPSYARGIRERLGFGSRQTTPGIWVHAVSVGEVQAAAPLLQALRHRYPALPVTVTTATPTGAARARAMFPDEVTVRFLPWDSPGCVRRFLDRIQPRLAVIVEKEWWPVLYRECGRRSIPVLLAGAILSARSESHYRLLAPVCRETLRQHLTVAARAEEDAARFRALGVPAERVTVIGHLKFDIDAAASAERGVAVREACGWAGRFVLVAGSTYAEEEAALLDVQQRLAGEGLALALVLAPRHPPRFDSVAMQLSTRGLSYRRRSSGTLVTSDAATVPAGHDDTEIWLLDTLGELRHFYAAADLAFVGGSLVSDVGGHNLLEPAALGVPTLTGPYGYNAPEVTAALVDAGAVEIVQDAAHLAAAVGRLIRDAEERQRRGAFGRQFVQRNRGALERLLAQLAPLIERESSPSANR